MKLLLFTTILFCGISASISTFNQHQKLIHRFARNPKGECRYEKGPWEDCDFNTGVQKRVLKLKSARSATTCEPVKQIQRSCKKNCRYAKGTWSECVQGTRNRIDTIKNDVPSLNSNTMCEPIRNITKACKEPCRYEKSEWSICENGVKTKTLTLTNGGSSNCQPTKLITKECRQANQRRQEKQRKRKNQARVDASQE